MQYTLHLTANDLEALHAHAESSLPFEAVALLFGEQSELSVTVNRIELTNNEATSRAPAFIVNPEEQYRLLVEAENRGEEFVGIFHSHPAPPHPSNRDKQNMKINPVVWLIASKDSGHWTTNAFLLENDHVRQVALQLM